MEQGLPLCSNPRSSIGGQAAPFQALCPQGSGCGHQGWTSPDVDNSATPVPGLHGHRPNTPCGLGPSQAPTPQLTGPQLPCCIRLLSSCTHPRACYTTAVRAHGTHTPGGPTVPEETTALWGGQGPSTASWHLELGRVCVGGGGAPGQEPGSAGSTTGPL